MGGSWQRGAGLEDRQLVSVLLLLTFLREGGPSHGLVPHPGAQAHLVDLLLPWDAAPRVLHDDDLGGEWLVLPHEIVVLPRRSKVARPLGRIGCVGRRRMRRPVRVVAGGGGGLSRLLLGGRLLSGCQLSR